MLLHPAVAIAVTATLSVTVTVAPALQPPDAIVSVTLPAAFAEGNGVFVQLLAATLLAITA